MSVKTIQQQKLQQAAAGNPVLLELLQSLANTVTLTQQATNTTHRTVPPQAKADVSYLKGNYIVQIQNPGATSALSQLQAAQASQGNTQASSVQAVTSVLHQIRVATTPGFSVSGNVKVFGGDTGSTQTYWTLTNLGSGNFYFQVRSSYDGVSWNQWKNANGGQSITRSPAQVTLESANNADWAVFALPGQQIVAVGQGFVGDQGTFGLPLNLYSSALAAIAGPNGYTDAAHHVSDLVNCDVSINAPSNTSGAIGIPDFPTLVSMKYGDHGTPQNLWQGSANIFAVAFDPAGTNVTRYPSGDGLSGWAVFNVPGGGKIAIGSGRGNDGDTIFLPSATPWITSSNLLSIVSPHGDFNTGLAHGIWQSALVGTTIRVRYADNDAGTGQWTGHGNWFAVAWTPGLNVATPTNGKWLILTLADGKQIAFGAGLVPQGQTFALPAGFTVQNLLAIPMPASFTGSLNAINGVAQCELIGTFPYLNYTDASGGHSWSGDCSFFAFAWS
jgi:hypothetical protein